MIGGEENLILNNHKISEIDQPRFDQHGEFSPGNLEWDSSVLEHTVPNGEQWYGGITDCETDPSTNLPVFDEYGDYQYRRRVVVQYADSTKIDTYVEIHEHNVTDIQLKCIELVCSIL